MMCVGAQVVGLLRGQRSLNQSRLYRTKNLVYSDASNFSMHGGLTSNNYSTSANFSEKREDYQRLER